MSHLFWYTSIIYIIQFISTEVYIYLVFSWSDLFLSWFQFLHYGYLTANQTPVLLWNTTASVGLGCVDTRLHMERNCLNKWETRLWDFIKMGEGGRLLNMSWSTFPAVVKNRSASDRSVVLIALKMDSSASVSLTDQALWRTLHQVKLYTLYPGGKPI